MRTIQINGKDIEAVPFPENKYVSYTYDFWYKDDDGDTVDDRYDIWVYESGVVSVMADANCMGYEIKRYEEGKDGTLSDCINKAIEYIENAVKDIEVEV